MTTASKSKPVPGDVQNSARDPLVDRYVALMGEKPKGMRTREWAAKINSKMMGPISHRQIDLAGVVIDRGHERLEQAVNDQQVKMHTAAIIAELSDDELDAVLNGGKSDINRTVRSLRPHPSARRFRGARAKALETIEEAAVTDAVHFIGKKSNDSLSYIQERMRQTFARLIETEPDEVAHVLYTARKEFEGHYWLFVANMAILRLSSIGEK